ncbi:MAG: hypothetical protein WBE26_11665 [Phycisphaerae bacterium]
MTTRNATHASQAIPAITNGHRGSGGALPTGTFGSAQSIRGF